MPTYKDIQGLVKQRFGFSAQPCWISECKAIALNLPNPQLNRDGSSRKKQLRQPLLPEKKKAILEVMVEVGIPDGKALEKS